MYCQVSLHQSLDGHQAGTKQAMKICARAAIAGRLRCKGQKWWRSDFIVCPLGQIS